MAYLEAEDVGGIGGYSAGQQLGAGVGGGTSPLQELGELATVGKASPAYPDVLLQAQVLHLVLDPNREGRLSPLGGYSLVLGVGGWSWEWVGGPGQGWKGQTWGLVGLDLCQEQFGVGGDFSVSPRGQPVSSVGWGPSFQGGRGLCSFCGQFQSSS